MSMKQEYKELEAKRRAEIKNLHLTYLRTKRDIKRTLSPDRMIRRHLGLSIGAAAVAGLLLAPRLGGKKQRPGPGIGGSITQWLRKMTDKIVPSLSKYIPDLEGKQEHVSAGEEQANGSHEFFERERRRKKSPSFLGRLLADVAMMMLTRVDLSRVVRGMMHRENGHRRNGHSEPRITVADAGAMHEENPD